ncbi:MAG: hypothetical protein U0163_16385 [Gemmatimonadaceae bacterium]
MRVLVNTVGVLLALAVCAAPTLRAQDSHASVASAVERLAEAGAAARTLGPIDEALALIDRALAAAPTDSVFLHYKGYAFYRKGSLEMALGHRSDAARSLDSAAASLRASSATLAWADTYALLGAAIGERIGVSGNPFSAMRNGPKSNAALDRAAKLGPANPRVFLLRGMGAFYKPRMFGGGADKAIQELEHALKLFETDSAASPLPTWGRGEAYAFLGLVRASEGRRDDAIAAYERALSFTPLQVLVRDSLLPSVRGRR